MRRCLAHVNIAKARAVRLFDRRVVAQKGSSFCLLLLNFEPKQPAHMYCFRCDSPETASIFQTNLQVLINRPENRRRIGQVEKRPVMDGLLKVARQQQQGSETPEQWCSQLDSSRDGDGDRDGDGCALIGTPDDGACVNYVSMDVLFEKIFPLLDYVNRFGEERH